MNDNNTAVVPQGRPGDFDPEPKPRVGGGKIATSADDHPFRAPTGNDLVSGKQESGPEFRSSWFGLGAWLVCWTILLWLGFKIGVVVQHTIRLGTPLREFALFAEGVLIIAVAIWLFRIVRAFSSKQPRQWNPEDVREPAKKGLVDYYKTLATDKDCFRRFCNQFPETSSKDSECVFSRQAAGDALKSLSVFDSTRLGKWSDNRKAFDEAVEERARTIIGDHALLVAIKTAGSPWKIVDVLAVFYNSTRMIERIASLYGRTCSGAKAFRLACDWAFDLYVAGHLGEIAEKGSETLVEKLVDVLGKDAEGAGPWFGQIIPAAGKLFAKVGEGTVNYWLCRRLGNKAVEYFRPISQG